MQRDLRMQISPEPGAGKKSAKSSYREEADPNPLLILLLKVTQVGPGGVSL